MVGGTGRAGESAPSDDMRGAPWVHRLLADVLGVAVGCAAVGALLGSVGAAPMLAGVVAHHLVTLAAVAVGGGAAIVSGLASRLTGEPGPAWLAAGLVGYGVILVPWLTVAPAAAVSSPERLSRLVVHLAALVVLGLSARPPRRLGTSGGWLVLVVGGGLAVAALWVPDHPAGTKLFESPASDALILLGWVAAATGYLLGGARRQDPARLRIGLGLAVLALAQLCRMVIAAPGGPELVSAGLRLLGSVIVLVGVAQGVQRALTALREVHRRQQDELTAAEVQRERAGELAAERDHELRNGLAGLAGITHLLDVDGREHEPLKHAVLAELSRLHLILDGAATDPAEADPAEPAVDYEVGPVLLGLVTLRRSGGNQVRLRAGPGLRARGHPAVLAQVVTNLLANCDRHAPGAAVVVTARQVGTTVVIAVRDDGPGLSGRLRGSALERGTRDESAGGSGLGLHISRQLIGREGGTLTVRSLERPRGCLATVTVPAAATDRPAGAGSASTGAPSSR